MGGRGEPQNLANGAAEFVKICRGKLWALLVASFDELNSDCVVLAYTSAEVFSGRFDVESSAVYNRAVIRLEQAIFSQQLASSGQLYVYQTTRFWSQIKSAG